jgi:hypothetical protein
MKYTIYNPSTGQIISTKSFSQDQPIPTDISTIPGEYSTDYYVVNGQPVKKSPNPSNHWSRYDYNYHTHTWEINPVITSFLIRQHRDQLLGLVDRINPVWYASLSSEQQQELAGYRQALLDVPQQTGFPINIVWPAKPHWL